MTKPSSQSAICILYQVKNNIITEKDGKKALTMVNKKLTKELLEAFPEFAQQKNPPKLGDIVSVPNTSSSKNLQLIESFDMEAEFVFPDGYKDKEDNEKYMTDAHKEASKRLDDKQDFQRQMRNHVSWFLSMGWEVSAFTGTHFVFSINLDKWGR